jgi:hypothetical protein
MVPKASDGAAEPSLGAASRPTPIRNRHPRGAANADSPTSAAHRRKGRKRPHTRASPAMTERPRSANHAVCRAFLSTPNRIRTGDLLRESSEIRSAAISSYAGLLGPRHGPRERHSFTGFCGSFPDVLSATGGPRPKPQAPVAPLRGSLSQPPERGHTTCIGDAGRPGGAPC